MKRILIIDDQEAICYSLKKLFKRKGYAVDAINDPVVALKTWRAFNPDVLLVDYKMPLMNGIELMKVLKGDGCNVPVIILTAYAESEYAVEAISSGAYDYILKPFDNDVLIRSVENAIANSTISDIQNINIAPVKKMIGRSQKMIDVYKTIGKVSNTDTMVLITGESGTGKDIAAHIIHMNSDRKDNMFYPLNCAAIPESLFESELFGYEKGAFTGANEKSIGVLERIEKGTLFLDEIGEMPTNAQAKLLKFLDSGAYQSVGSRVLKKSDIRVIAATNKDLQNLVMHNKFREDLYYRLNVFQIELPPLRERKEDIKPLLEYFLKYYASKHKKLIYDYSQQLLNVLMNCDWPGNVRQFENVIERAVILSNKLILDSDDINLEIPPADIEQLNVEELGLTKYLNGVARKICRNSLSENHGNQMKTARSLKISRNTLRKFTL